MIFKYLVVFYFGLCFLGLADLQGQSEGFEAKVLVVLPSSPLKISKLREKQAQASTPEAQTYWDKEIAKTQAYDLNLSQSLRGAFTRSYPYEHYFVGDTSLRRLRGGDCWGLLYDALGQPLEDDLKDSVCGEPLYLCMHYEADAQYPYNTLRFEALRGYLPKGFPAIIPLRPGLLNHPMERQVTKGLERWQRRLKKAKLD